MISNNNPAPGTHKLVVKRQFEAPRELVWQAWTTPAQIKTWLEFGDGMKPESIQIDLRVGGRFRIQSKAPDGEYYTAAGSYLEVQPPDRLVYTWDWEKDGAGTEFGELEGKETLLTIEFLALGQRTELILTHEKFDSVERRDRHIAGWNAWLERMAAFVGAK